MKVQSREKNVSEKSVAHARRASAALAQNNACAITNVLNATFLDAIAAVCSRAWAAFDVRYALRLFQRLRKQSDHRAVGL